MKKEKQKISTILLSVFFVIILLLVGAIYALPKYLFINASVEFDSAESNKTVVAAEIKKLKLPDFSIFQGTKFEVLKKGYWYIADESSFEIGNSKPFARIITTSKEDQESADIK